MRCKGVSPFESAKYDGVPASKSIMAVLAKLRLTAPEIEKEKCCYFFVVLINLIKNHLNCLIFQGLASEEDPENRLNLEPTRYIKV